jgi:hypothetical protein
MSEAFYRNATVDIPEMSEAYDVDVVWRKGTRTFLWFDDFNMSKSELEEVTPDADLPSRMVVIDIR